MSQSASSSRNYEQSLGRQTASVELIRPVAFLDEEEVPFKIKQYKKSELAALYGIHLNTLATWINRHYDTFQKIGYHKQLHVLDPAMVRLFVAIFSTP